MASLPLTVNPPHKEEIEYNGKFGHTLEITAHFSYD